MDVDKMIRNGCKICTPIVTTRLGESDVSLYPPQPWTLLSSRRIAAVFYSQFSKLEAAYSEEFWAVG